MNFFDVIAAAVVLIFLAIGLRLGVISTSVFTASGFIGLFVAKNYSEKLSMDYYAVFALSIVAVLVAGFLIKRFVKSTFLGVFDNIIGGVLGTVVGLLMVVIMLLPLYRDVSKGSIQTINRSFFAKKVSPVLDRFSGNAKGERIGKIRRSIEQKLDFDMAQRLLPKLERKKEA